MILIQKKLDFVTEFEIANRTERIVIGTEKPTCVTMDSYREAVKSVILDTRPFDVAQYPNLKVISRVGVGVDNIDLEECKKRNIKVYTTPCYELYQAVADFTIKQLLSLMSINKLRDDLDGSGKNVVIIGAGNIGKEVGLLLEHFGCVVYYFDKNMNSTDNTYSMNDLYEFLPQADIVSVHISGTDCVLGKKEIDVLKDGCYVLNMARQGCVDFEYIFKSIVGGINIKYASDVDSYRGFSLEAVEFSCNFSSLVNYRVKQSILITPHIASKTVAARKAMENMALDNLVRGLSE